MEPACDSLLLTGGTGPSRPQILPYLEGVSFVVAADAGFDLALRLGLRPDLLVGDLDSVRPGRELAELPADRIVRYPPDKDETDTEIGLRVLDERGYRRVLLAGGGGGRLDHLLALLNLFERGTHPALWLTDRERVQAIDRELEFTGRPGETVSLFPLGEGAWDLASQGLRWPLAGLEWPRGTAGISNRMTADRARVTVGRGRLLLVRGLPPV
jgi:thiamine pyrophosphokinase